MESSSKTASSLTAVPEFVRKLFRMLDDKNHEQTVSWTERGDTFVVKDPNNFARDVLPRHFKHNNFASFVRQLNKYDFHKVVQMKTESKRSPYGDQAWEFRHQNFTRHGVEQLSAIKRKTVARKEGSDEQQQNELKQENDELQYQVENLTRTQKEMSGFIQTLATNYELIVREMFNFKNTMAAQDQILQNLLQYFVGKESSSSSASGFSMPLALLEAAGRRGGVHTNSQSYDRPLNLPQSLAQPQDNPSQPQHNFASPFQSSYSSNSSQAMHQNMPSISQHQQEEGQLPLWSPSDLLKAPDSIPNISFNANVSDTASASLNQMDELSRRSRMHTQSPSSSSPSASNDNSNSLTVCTVGMLRPRLEDLPSRSNSVRVVRSTFVPAWSVPPKVLLVEDDAMCRMIASKLLQIFGCSFEIAHDGIEAVNKMNLEKYDIVLMDIVMPNLDGVSATSQIRQFDLSTPVISMTSNTSREDVMHYLSNGMNDILPKPFSKTTLLSMLERYCVNVPVPIYHQPSTFGSTFDADHVSEDSDLRSPVVTAQENDGRLSKRSKYL